MPGRALTPTGEIADAGILIRETVIEAIGPREGMSLPADATEISATDKSAIPGFVDVHIHGAGGRDVMEGSDEALSTVAKTVARHGTTSMVATTVTASADDICRSCEGIAKYIATQHEGPEPRAKVLGIHFEGPFLSEIRRGVHPAEWLTIAVGGIAGSIRGRGGWKCADADDCPGAAGRHSVYRCGHQRRAW